MGHILAPFDLGSSGVEVLGHAQLQVVVDAPRFDLSAVGWAG